MPFYEYECPSCKFYAEVLQKISDKPLKKCSSCGKTGFKRLISAPVFRLKGSGWYETDFKGDKDNKRNLAGAEREETKPATDAKADDKADDKADAKTADANKPGVETSQTESAAPAKTDKVEKTGSDSKSGSESAKSSSAERSGSSSAKSSSKSAPTRSTKRPTKVVARGRRRR